MRTFDKIGWVLSINNRGDFLMGGKKDNASESFFSLMSIAEYSLWEKIGLSRVPLSFSLELTSRCNNNCRHCYINRPAGDRDAKQKELCFEDIKDIVDEAVSMGALWCLVTGGEPLLREDFPDIYLYLKQKGLLVTLFTNATLINREHIKLFAKYPPRDVEVSVYGASRHTYEKVTRHPGSYFSFRQGLDHLLECGSRVRLKAMVLKSNYRDLPAIARFCRERTNGAFRFDPFLHLRVDGNQLRNAEIKAERLSANQIVALERSDPDRFKALNRECNMLVNTEFCHTSSNKLFFCGAGMSSFFVDCEGRFRLCSSLSHPDCTYDLRRGSLAEAWYKFTPAIRDMHSERTDYLENCGSCPIVNLCMWCPANAYLESGKFDLPVEYFCEVAHQRMVLIQGKEGLPDSREDEAPEGHASFQGNDKKLKTKEEVSAL